MEERPIIGGAGNAKFGLTDAEADEAVARMRAAGVLADAGHEPSVPAVGPGGPYVLRGFHAFGASNVRDAGLLVQGAADLARRAERIAQRHGLALELLDAGGGLGIPYTDDEAPLDVTAMGEGLAAELATWAGRPALAGCRLLLEPGRWLLGPAGAYLCRVVRTKARDGRHVAIMDGGIHHLLRPRLVGQDHRVVPVGEAAVRPRDARVDVVGPALHRPGRAGRRRGAAGPAGGRRLRRARRRRLRLQRVDALLPLAPDPGRGRGGAG